MVALTEPMVIAKTRLSNLATIKKLNFWGSELSDVSIVKQMQRVEILAFSVNKITSLEPFQYCVNLQELYIRKNNIQDINEVIHLQSLTKLKYLWLEDNPCVANAGPNYRSIVLSILPNLKKLDNTEVTSEETEVAIRSHLRTQQPQTDDLNEQQSGQKQTVVAVQDSLAFERQIQGPTKEQNIAKLEENSNENNNEIPEVAKPKIEQNLLVSEAAFQQTTPVKKHFRPTEYHNSDLLEILPTGQIIHSYSELSRSDCAINQTEKTPLTQELGTIQIPLSYNLPDNHYTQFQGRIQSQHPKSQKSVQQGRSISMTCSDKYTGMEPLSKRSSIDSSGKYGNEWDRSKNIQQDNNEFEDDMSQRDDDRMERRIINTSTKPFYTQIQYVPYHRKPAQRNSNLVSAALCIIKELDLHGLEIVEHAIQCHIVKMIKKHNATTGFDKALRNCKDVEKILKVSINHAHRLNIRYNAVSYSNNLKLLLDSMTPMYQLHCNPNPFTKELKHSAGDIYASNNVMNLKVIKVKRNVESLLCSVQNTIKVNNKKNVNLLKQKSHLTFHRNIRKNKYTCFM